MDELRKEAIEAKQMPGRHAEFKIKRLNRREAAAGRWVNLPKWKLCNAPVDLGYLRRFPCWGGLDLASVSDLTAFRLVWLVGRVWFTKGWRFVPEAAVKRRSERGLVPYAHWLQSGHLLPGGDESIDHDIVSNKIIDVCTQFDVRSIGYDTWNASQVAKVLEDAGHTMNPVIQGAKSYHPAIKEVERAYLAKQVAHGDDPVFNWNMANLVMRLDANMNMAPDKKKSMEKIDDGCAFFMAVAQAVGTEDEPSIIDALRSPIVG
jgi:phage terminase large subunit-like protein